MLRLKTCAGAAFFKIEISGGEQTSFCSPVKGSGCAGLSDFTYENN
jgi:hypothetical protein